MHVTTDNRYLIELFKTGKSNDRRYKKLPQSAIKGFVKAVRILEKSNRIEDLFQFKGLNYERLKGNLKDFESVRCDSRYRLLFKSGSSDGSIVITEIELYEITDHYGSL